MAAIGCSTPVNKNASITSRKGFAFLRKNVQSNVVGSAVTEKISHVKQVTFVVVKKCKKSISFAVSVTRRSNLFWSFTYLVNLFKNSKTFESKGLPKIFPTFRS